eukprot:gene6111-8426_t
MNANPNHGQRHLQDLTTIINISVVYSSLLIIIVACCYCLVMFVLRRKININNANEDKEGLKTFDSTTNTKSKSEKNKKKEKKKKSKSKKDGTATSSVGSASETSSLLDSVDTNSIDEGVNKALKDAFISVLTEGLTLIFHTMKGPVQVRLSLVNNELRWKPVKLFTTKLYKQQMSEILYVEWGKQTEIFRNSTAKDVKDEICFSLIVKQDTKNGGAALGGSIDFETSGKMERDALVQGFMLTLSDFQGLNDTA